jgi:hypothetical protein
MVPVRVTAGWPGEIRRVLRVYRRGCGGGASFAKGMIFFKFPLSTKSKTFAGTLTGGTGAYSGAKGTISGKAITSKKEAVTIR